MEVISGEKIVKSYGKFKVLKGINLNVQDGEFVGIMGKSGSGKTMGHFYTRKMKYQNCQIKNLREYEEKN